MPLHSDQGFPDDFGAFDLGEVSYHAGWTFHHAGPNTTDQPRAVMTVIYMEDGIRLIAPRRQEHRADRTAFLPGLQPGDAAATPLLYHCAQAG
jgi:hypothetical protein